MFSDYDPDPDETPPCRMCLKTEVDELISLFARCSSQQKLVSEMLSELTQLSQYDMGVASQYICGKCLEQLDKACTFRKRCRDTNRFFTAQLLRNSLKNVDGCCRLCEDDEPDELISVFCICEGKLVAEIIGEAVGIRKPAKADGLPQNICAECLNQLTCAAQLREMVLQNDASMQASHVELEEDSMNAEELFNVAEEGWSVPGVTKKVRIRRPKPQPPPEDEVDPFIYLDVPGVEGEKLQEAFDTVAEGEIYDQLLFSGLICCCGKLFENEQELQKHRKVVHSKQEIAWSHIKCKDCLKRFKSKRDLERHQNERERKQFYRCKICNVLTKEMTTLKIHFEFTRFHPWLEPSDEERENFDREVDTVYEIDGRCCACEGEFEDAETLLEHVKEMHYDERDAVPMFQCTICYSSFSDRKSLMKHQQSFSGTRIYHCRKEGCTFKSDQREAIRKHVETGLHCDVADLPENLIEELPEEFFCCFRDCHEVYPSRLELEQHCSNVHEEKRSINHHFSKDAIGGQVCDLCKRHFPTLEAYERHVRTITDRKFMCTACSHRFSTREQLSRHEKYYHLPADEREPKVVHQCPLCPATLGTPYTLHQHIRNVHERVASELCKTCGKSFRTKNQLKSHEANTHMKNRPYRCTHCPMSFGAKGLLQRHILGHTDERRFPCQYCGKEYKYPSDTKRHEQAVHLNELPHECEFCGKCFVRARDLRLHMTSHTNRKLFQCAVPGCEFSTNIGKTLNAHNQEEHGMEVEDDSD